MGRQLRIVFPGMAYHVMARGNERKNIYREESDRTKFLNILKDAIKIFDFRLYAYALMSNHYHFLIKIEKPNLSQIIQYINTRHAIFFNLKYKRNGHLFQNKFKSVIVEHGPELQNCMRYIHLNPLTAGMIDDLDKYPWTSHRQYRGQDDNGPAEYQHLLKLFSDVRAEAILKYEGFMGEGGMKDKDGDQMYCFGKHAIGSEDFVRRIKLLFKEKSLSEEINNRIELKKVYPEDIIISSVCGFCKLTPEQLEKKGGWNSHKPIAYYLLSRDGGLKNIEISRLFSNIHPSVIGRRINEIAAKVDRDYKLKKEIGAIREKYEVKNQKKQ